MRGWYDFSKVIQNVTFLFGSRGPRPDLPSPFGRNFSFASVEDSFLLSTTPLRLEDGSLLIKLSFIGESYSGFGLLTF